MTPFLVAYASTRLHPTVVDAALDAEIGFAVLVPASPHGLHDRGDPEQPIILLGIGPEGCAAVAKRCAEGLDGVACVVLVGPEAPWAERCRRCGVDGLAKIDSDAAGNAIEAPCPWCNGHRLPLGPLEPLRTVAERARRGEPCPNCLSEMGVHPCQMMCSDDRLYQVHLIVTAHPEPAKCAACNGRGRQGSAWGSEGSYDCNACSGTGNALGSAEIAREIFGNTWQDYKSDARVETWPPSGFTVLKYTDRASHDSHPIADALKIALS